MENERGVGGLYADQIAVGGGADCTFADDTISYAGPPGDPFNYGETVCTPTKEGPGSRWSSAWIGTYDKYSCSNGTDKVAFNMGQPSTASSQTAGTTTTTAPSSSGASRGIPPAGQTTASGKLLPAPIGDGMCTAGSVSDGVYAKVAILNTACSTLVTVVTPAGVDRGAPYSTDGFSCTATAESASSSPWDSAWNSTYYAYTCVDGSEQVAFNWGTEYSYQ